MKKSTVLGILGAVLGAGIGVVSTLASAEGGKEAISQEIQKKELEIQQKKQKLEDDE